jgi:ATP-dependent DNA ligase
LVSLPDDTAVDGEIVALDEAGKLSFNALQNYGSSNADLIYSSSMSWCLPGRT